MSEEHGIFQAALSALGIKKSDDHSLSRSSSVSSLNDSPQRFSPASSPLIGNEDDLVCRICECYVSQDIFKDHTHDCALAHELADKLIEIEHKLNKLEPLLGLSRHASRDSLTTISNNSSNDLLKLKANHSSPQIDQLSSSSSPQLSIESLPDLHKSNRHSSGNKFNLFKSTSSLPPSSPTTNISNHQDTHLLLILIIKSKKLQWHIPESITKCDKYLVKLANLPANPASHTNKDPSFSSILRKTHDLLHQKRALLLQWQPLYASYFLDQIYLKTLQHKHTKKSNNPLTSFFNVLYRRSRRKSSMNEGNPVDMSDFKLIKPISKGAYGSVFLTRKTNTNDIFAIKIMRKNEMVLKNMVANCLTERKVLSILQSDYVVKMFWAFQSNHHLYLVMEYLCGGDLSSLLCQLGVFPVAMIQQYSAEISVALAYLHANQIIHGDIKPDNVLIDQQGHLKLTDFGLTTTTASLPSAHIVGTPDYLAPELLNNSKGDKMVDYWALGVMMYEFLQGIPPFHGVDGQVQEIFKRILAYQGSLFFDEEEETAALQDVIHGLLTKDVGKRFELAQLKQHVFYAGLDWEGIRERKALFIPKIKAEDLDVGYFEARNQHIGPITMDADALMVGQLAQPPEGEVLFEKFGFKNTKLLKELNQDSSSVYDSSD